MKYSVKFAMLNAMDYLSLILHSGSCRIAKFDLISNVEIRAQIQQWCFSGLLCVVRNRVPGSALLQGRWFAGIVLVHSSVSPQLCRMREGVDVLIWRCVVGPLYLPVLFW